MKSFNLAISLFGLLLCSSSVNASYYSGYLGVWSQHYSGDLIDDEGPKDVESQLQIEDRANFEAGLIWHGQDGWIPNIRLSVFQIQASGRNTISQAGSFDLLGIPVVTATGSADVSTQIDYLIWGSNFFYGLPWRGIDFEIGGTLNFIDGIVEADVDYDATAEAAGRVDEQRRNTTQSIVPTAYGAARKKLNDWLTLHLHLYGASTGTDSVGQYSIALQAESVYGLTLLGGYRSQHVDFFDEDKSTGLDVTIAGLFAGLSYNF
jgi:hypothetical protein